MLPMGRAALSGIAAEDIGKCAYGVFKRPDLIGKRVGVAGEHLTGDEMAAAMGRALGEEVRYEAMSPEAYRGLGFPAAEELGNMFQFYQEFAGEFAKVRGVEASRSLNPELQSFDTWLSRNKDRIPIG
jgi:hypothetical protein